MAAGSCDLAVMLVGMRRRERRGPPCTRDVARFSGDRPASTVAEVGAARPVRVTRALAGLGGGLLIAAFFLPLFDTSTGAVGREIFGVEDLRAEIEEVRSVAATRPFLEPALRQLELFGDTPSLRNFSTLAVASREVFDAASALEVEDADKLRRFSTILGAVRTCLWLLPLVGLVQLMALLRRRAGVVELVARFGFGLLFFLVAVIPLAGVTALERPLVGEGVWALLLGSAALMVAGLLGVTRRTRSRVLAADLALLIVAGFGVAALADSLRV